MLKACSLGILKKLKNKNKKIPTSKNKQPLLLFFNDRVSVLQEKNLIHTPNIFLPSFINSTFKVSAGIRTLCLLSKP